MLRGNFVQINIDRLVYTRNRYNALLPQWFSTSQGLSFLPFGGSKKSQMFGLAIAGRNGISVEIHQILAGVDIFFWTECTFLSNYYGLDPFQGSVIL